MKVLFVNDSYYSATDHGVYAYGAFPYALWAERFLPHFDDLTVVGRGKDLSGRSDRLDRSDGDHVEFQLFPNINSPLKRVFGSGRVYDGIEALVLAHDAVIVRGPVEMGMMAAKAARKHGKPLAVEMSGCAFDHTWYHGSLVGKLYAPLKYLRAQKMLYHAHFIIYVTKYCLQRRYPTQARVTENASNVELPVVSADVLTRRLEKIGAFKAAKSPRFIFGLVGNYGNNLKGVGVALKAFARIKTALPDFEFRILGQGDSAQWMALAAQLGLQDHVVFSPSVPGGSAVYDWLDGVDIYLQPSFHEGLPRALIEAMSRGLPAVASDAGGSDELLEARHIHRRGDDKALSAHLLDLVRDIDGQAEQATRNFEIAKGYTRDVLKQKRFVFWEKFKAFAQDSMEGSTKIQ